MRKKRRIGLFFTIVLILSVLGFLSWFLMTIFEGGNPQIVIQPLPEYLTADQKFSLVVTDTERGLRTIKVTVKQGGREVPVFSQSFPFQGLLNRGGVHRHETEFFIDPSQLNLAQGRVDLEIQVRDYSRRSGGDGNLGLLSHKMTVDTIPPAIRAVSRIHYVNLGGSGLIVYETSSDTDESGLYVKDLFFQGYAASSEGRDGLCVCYFAISYNMEAKPDIFLWAKDKAGNVSKAGFYCRIRKKRFRRDRINITDRFLKRILPYFATVSFAADSGNKEKFLKINRDLRQKNAETFYDLRTRTSDERLWGDENWVRLRNAATMARFADHRTYYYRGKKIDEQVHLGVDLASLAQSPVQAANSGRTIFAGDMGIYGLTVVIDHGQGISSGYSHLSKISVQTGQEISRGEEIGFTGQTGLAGGDHLHFGIMVHGIPVNPIEWWDPHWVEDNILRKLRLLNGK